MPTSRTRTPGWIRSVSLSFRHGSRLDNGRRIITKYAASSGRWTWWNRELWSCYELAVQGRTDSLQLRRSRARREDVVDRREEFARAEAPARGEEGRSNFLLPHRRRQIGCRNRQSSGGRLSGSGGQIRQALRRRRHAAEEAEDARDPRIDQG